MRRHIRSILRILAVPPLALGATSCAPQAITEPGSSRHTITVDGFPRSYRVFVPSTYRRGRAAPLVLAYHGLGGTGEQMLALTRLEERAERDAFVVVLPDAYPGANRGWAMNCDHCTPADTLGIDDVKFTEAIVAEVRSRFDIDMARVYATGFSMGGWFTHVLACARPELVAAIAPVGALIPRPVALACTPSRPVALAMILGTADRLQRWEGTPGQYGVLGADSSALHWARMNGCGANASSTVIGTWYLTLGLGARTGAVIRREWPECRNGAAVRQYRVEELGHDWPESATDEIVDFFRHHRRDR